MKYKIDIKTRLEIKAKELKSLYPNKVVYKSFLSTTDSSYTEKDEKLIINMKNEDFTDKAIAKTLNKPYGEIVDKIRRLRKDGKL